MLGDEGAGSLLSWARGEGYASGISASASPDGSTGLRLDLAYELNITVIAGFPLLNDVHDRGCCQNTVIGASVPELEAEAIGNIA